MCFQTWKHTSNFTKEISNRYNKFCLCKIVSKISCTHTYRFITWIPTGLLYTRLRENYLTESHVYVSYCVMCIGRGFRQLCSETILPWRLGLTDGKIFKRTRVLWGKNHNNTRWVARCSNIIIVKKNIATRQSSKNRRTHNDNTISLIHRDVMLCYMI